jgi:hypothetical protein
LLTLAKRGAEAQAIYAYLPRCNIDFLLEKIVALDPQHEWISAIYQRSEEVKKKILIFSQVIEMPAYRHRDAGHQGKLETLEFCPISDFLLSFSCCVP